jgi:spore coat polysaccharide biosynthesis protein SpsF (cytidylyltransferase family)
MRAVPIEEYTTSVDTPEDLKFIKKMMERDEIKLKYM